MLDAARRLLGSCAGLIRDRGLTLIGVALANLDDADAVQLELPFADRDRSGLDSVIDRVRDRYGTRSINRARLIGFDVNPVMPMLAD